MFFREPSKVDGPNSHTCTWTGSQNFSKQAIEAMKNSKNLEVLKSKFFENLWKNNKTLIPQKLKNIFQGQIYNSWKTLTALYHRVANFNFCDNF